ncbi:hypothetical protein [Bradyrhizobium sp. CCBAU 45384]|uniref:hypothetical protein n=1 Tax=Bradyrhizobium sp. CCBAU 45384 TaxID=858428 RepID=UPI00230698C6|nr:hypothetical protein [Bradyrhizobium sp. CCBAU 45384]
MTAVPEDIGERRQRYVCLAYQDDPLRDPAARKWAEMASGQVASKEICIGIQGS